MARILIAENEQFFSQALEKMLQAEGHTATRAQNGKIAREILEREDFDCVISDAKLPIFSGLELAAWIRQFKPTPFIVMTGFADQADPKAPFGLMGVTLLIKPFHAEHVREALSATLPALSANPDRSYEALVPVPKNTLRKTGMAEFNLYIYVNGRPQKILRRGEPFVLEKLVPEGGAQLYTDRESLTTVMASSLMLGKAAAANTKIDPAKRAVRIQDTLQVLHEQMALIGLSQTSLETAVDMITTYLKSIDDTRIWDMISNLDAFSRPIYAQTLAVTTVCSLVAHDQQYSAQDCFKLITAALFHDIGQIAMDPVLIKTPRVLLTMKDRALLEKHVEFGVAMLQKSGWISAEVCTIVWQTHENEIGNGYPRGLKHLQIHPMARLIHVADEFCLAVMKSGGPGMKPARAIEALKDKREVDQKFVVALQRILTSNSVKQNA